jgi:hypothetical protein
MLTLIWANLLQGDQAALLAALHDPSGVYAQQLLGGKDGGCGAPGGPQHPTPRSSLDLMALGRSAYSSPRSSFEVPQVSCTLRCSFELKGRAMVDVAERAEVATLAAHEFLQQPSRPSMSTATLRPPFAVLGARDEVDAACSPCRSASDDRADDWVTID